MEAAASGCFTASCAYSTARSFSRWRVKYNSSLFCSLFIASACSEAVSGVAPSVVAIVGWPPVAPVGAADGVSSTDCLRFGVRALPFTLGCTALG